ncbi:hypothetical protein BHE97_02880 [Aeromicrobium sp. PE09-221]|uniref:YcnI family copper-binding membrane protein n=1 Tax=Aeromicrobium sp. PE09-221 TaxID=1898043 RepID=UPI000B3E5792|nr:YcnI family protein [Aeromicrobium sp. PE09-221]OUZ12150.1 hypothetical protein BHE97_02880 [Aeromicrobium sp. PE09-221]
MHRHLYRAALVGGTTAALVAFGASSASAHVTVSPSTTAAGAYSVLTFAFGHGCGESPTTQIAIDIPDESINVTPTINPTWQVEKVMETLDEPVDDGHGGEYTERVDQIVYTADAPLADGLRETFELSLQLTGDEDDKLVFPTIQTCEDGETAWIQTYEEGEPEPDTPAPYVTLTASEGDGHGHSDGEASASADDADAGGSNAVGWIGIALGALGLAAGGTALARTRRSS